MDFSPQFDMKVLGFCFVLLFACFFNNYAFSFQHLLCLNKVLSLENNASICHITSYQLQVVISNEVELLGLEP